MGFYMGFGCYFSFIHFGLYYFGNFLCEMCWSLWSFCTLGNCFQPSILVLNSLGKSLTCLINHDYFSILFQLKKFYLMGKYFCSLWKWFISLFPWKNLLFLKVTSVIFYGLSHFLKITLHLLSLLYCFYFHTKYLRIFLCYFRFMFYFIFYFHFCSYCCFWAFHQWSFKRFI